MQTSNPALKTDTFSSAYRQATTESGVMTLDGTVNKTGFLLFLLVVSAGWVWKQAFQAISYGQSVAEVNPGAITPWMMTGFIGGLIVSFIIIFKMNWAPILAPVYAVLEGFALGGVSALMEMRYPGIAMQATGLTFGTLLAMLLAYKAGMIKVNDKFRTGMLAATGAIALVYLASMVLGFFGVHIPFIYESGPIGIGFSMVVVVIAALSLVLDFDFIVQSTRRGAPKYMEWYAGFALMVTLVWLYLEILRLLAKLNDRK